MNHKPLPKAIDFLGYTSAADNTGLYAIFDEGGYESCRVSEITQPLT